MKDEKNSCNDLKFGTFVGRFWSDSVESLAVKGLMSVQCTGTEKGSSFQNWFQFGCVFQDNKSRVCGLRG